MPIAPTTFYDHLAKRAAPHAFSDRAKRDEELKSEIERVFEENLSVYGVRKVWRQMRREGFDVARHTVARLMKGWGWKASLAARSEGRPSQPSLSPVRWTRRTAS